MIGSKDPGRVDIGLLNIIRLAQTSSILRKAALGFDMSIKSQKPSKPREAHHVRAPGLVCWADIGEYDSLERAQAQNSQARAKVVSSVFASSMEGDRCRLEVRDNRCTRAWFTPIFGQEAFTG